MEAYSKGAFICKNEFLGGGLFKGAPIRRWGAYLRIYGKYFLKVCMKKTDMGWQEAYSIVLHQKKETLNLEISLVSLILPLVFQ